MRAARVLLLAVTFIPLSTLGGPPARAKHSPPAKPASPVLEDRWIWMPGGAFTFGCEPRSDCEKARGKRGVPEKVDGFWMMRGRTTVSEYEACVSAGACTGPGSKVRSRAWEGRASRPLSPVDFVNYGEAEQFCAWAGGRLPTEMEWEYAADSGHDMNRDILDTSRAYEWVQWSAPHPVPGYEATRGGLPDMEPLWPSDGGNARADSAYGLGFRCVQPVAPTKKPGAATDGPL
jgi:formylglycine-generating enzyme required for sulfatase activity